MRRLLWLVILVMVFAAAQAQPPEPADISMFPPPTGSNQVGRTTYHWVDESRDEINTDDESDYRELIVTIWYPADIEEGAELAPYREDLAGPNADDILAVYGVDRSDPLVNALIELQTHAYRDVSVSEAESSYPVLIFSHGAGGTPEDYSLQLLELASHGYIVIGINHAFYSSATAYPDGRVIGAVDFQRVQAETTSAEDVLFVLDQLESLNTRDDSFAGRLDLEHIGAFGHSMGGAVAVIAGSMDTRIRAVVNEDAFIAVESYPAIEQPFMFFSAGTPFFPAQGPKYTLIVNGFEHPSFTDFAAYGPDFGDIDGERTVEIVRVYLVTFFDKYLKDAPSDLLDGASDDYPEVSIETSNTQ